jgi:molybdopterin-guanine dinucleotide biosynthesis protein A
MPVVVVGPEPATVREAPPGGGPAAGLAAGLAAALGEHSTGPAAGRDPHSGERGDGPVVLALAGDHPFAGTAVPRLLSALAASDAEAALGVDPQGRRQYLLAAYRPAPLGRALGPAPAGRALRDVVAELRVTEVPVTDTEALDVDTAEDLDRARRLLD